MYKSKIAQINEYCEEYLTPVINDKYINYIYDYIHDDIIVPTNDNITNYYYGIISEIKNNFNLMLKHHKKSSSVYSLNALGVYYWKQQCENKSIKYFKKGYKKDPTCESLLYNLGTIYNHNKKFNKMKKYYGLAITNNCVDAPYKMGQYYFTKNKYDKMIKYWKIASERGNTYAMNGLGSYYELIVQDYDLMEKYYCTAILHKNYTMINKLYDFYNLTGQYVKATEIAFESNNKKIIDESIIHLVERKIYPPSNIIKKILTHKYIPFNSSHELNFHVWKNMATRSREI